MEVYFIRHGLTIANERKLFTGCGETPLSEKGRAELDGYSEKTKDLKFDKLYSSPLSRAIDTAKILFPNTEVTVDSRLREISFGIFEGKTHEEISTVYGEEARIWLSNWINTPIEGGESYAQVAKRGLDFVESIKDQKCEKVAVVAHGGLISSTLCSLLGDINLMHHIRVDNARYSMVELTPHFFLKTLNSSW